MSRPSQDADDDRPTTPSTPVSPGENPDTVAEGGAAVPGEDLPSGHAQTQPILPDGSPAPVDERSHLTADTEGEELDERHGAYPADADAPPPAGRDPLP